MQNVKDENGRTPLHIACTREASPNTVALVRLLLEYQADPNAVCNGQTPLTLAIALANEPVIDLLLNDPRTDPATVLGAGNGNALCVVLSTMFEARWPYQKRLKLVSFYACSEVFDTFSFASLDRTSHGKKSKSFVSCTIWS